MEWDLDTLPDETLGNLIQGHGSGQSHNSVSPLLQRASLHFQPLGPTKLRQSQAPVLASFFVECEIDFLPLEAVKYLIPGSLGELNGEYIKSFYVMLPVVRAPHSHLLMFILFLAALKKARVICLGAQMYFSPFWTLDAGGWLP